MYKIRHTNYEPDKERIFELVRAIDETISFDTVSELIDNCMNGDKKNVNFNDIEEHPAVKEARKVLEQRRFENDLKMIKDEYPEETAASVWDFGEPFLSLIMTGLVDALTAYEAYMAHKKRIRKHEPPFIGGAATSSASDKEFFTPEEVDRLPLSDYDDPVIMRKIRNSMLRWK